MADILEKPFGPYRDCDVLTDKCKTIPSRTLKLNDLFLECGGKPIGLTECEPCQGAQYARERIEKHPVRFRGVLEIDNLAWLTTWGQKAIEAELRRRDASARKSRSGKSTLTLENVYQRRKSVKIIVQGVKNMAALYLRSKTIEDGLMLQSEHQYRRYEVQTMDIRIYDHSRLFFSRYRTLKTLDDLLALDAQMHPPNSGGTPIVARTPHWLAHLYKKYLARPEAAAVRRLAHVSSDSDVEPATGGRLRAGRRRALRHVPTGEVLSLFAMHSEWLYTDQRKRREQRVNEQAWVRWVHEVRAARRSTARDGVRWGIWDEEQLAAMEEDLLEPREPPQKDSRKRRRASGSPPIPSRPAVPPGPSPALRVSTRLTRSAALTQRASENVRTYDPDFSPDSTPPASPTSSDASLPKRPPTPPDPAIMALFPPAFFHPPRIPLSFRWTCPAPACPYAIDLRALTRDNVRALTERQVRRLTTRGWTLFEPWVQGCFGRMVSAHIEEHVDRAGVRMWEKDGLWKFAWKKPQHHAPWPPTRAPQVPKIKTEDDAELEEFTTSSEEE